MKEKRVGSIKNVDLSGLRFPVIAVYESPADFKGKCVARVFDMDKPTDTIIVKDTAEEIRDLFADIAHELGKCVIVVTHSQAFSQKADVVVELEEKQLKAVQVRG